MVKVKCAKFLKKDSRTGHPRGKDVHATTTDPGTNGRRKKEGCLKEEDNQIIFQCIIIKSICMRAMSKSVTIM